MVRSAAPFERGKVEGAFGVSTQALPVRQAATAANVAELERMAILLMGHEGAGTRGSLYDAREAPAIIVS